MRDNRHPEITRSFENTYRKPRWVFDATFYVLLATVIVAH